MAHGCSNFNKLIKTLDEEDTGWVLNWQPASSWTHLELQEFPYSEYTLQTLLKVKEHLPLNDEIEWLHP